MNENILTRERYVTILDDKFIYCYIATSHNRNWFFIDVNKIKNEEIKTYDTKERARGAILRASKGNEKIKDALTNNRIKHEKISMLFMRETDGTIKV